MIISLVLLSLPCLSGGFDKVDIKSVCLTGSITRVTSGRHSGSHITLQVRSRSHVVTWSRSHVGAGHTGSRDSVAGVSELASHWVRVRLDRIGSD